MRFVLEIDCDGPVFEDDAREEVAWILGSLGCPVLAGPLAGAVLDREDNPIGSWRFIAAPGPDPDGASSPDLGMVMATDEGGSA